MRQRILSSALAAFFLVAGLAGTSNSSWAQQMSYSTSEIRACICAQRAVASLSARMKAEVGAYQSKRDEVDLLNREVEEARTRVNVNDQSDVEAFRALLDKRDASALDLSNRVGPQYSDTVARYNEAAEENNSYCTGKLFDREQVAAVGMNLSCPRE